MKGLVGGPLLVGGLAWPWAPLKSGRVMYGISIGATMHSLTTNEIQVFFCSRPSEIRIEFYR